MLILHLRQNLCSRRQVGVRAKYARGPNRAEVLVAVMFNLEPMGRVSSVNGNAERTSSSSVDI